MAVVHRRLGRMFDWRGFVAVNHPSDGPQASQLQRDRLRLVDRIRTDLESWSSHYGIADIWMGDWETFRKRLAYTAHACATRSPDPSDELQASLLGRTSLWIWAVDHFIDNELLPVLSGCDWSLQRKVATLDGHLDAITAPLFSHGGLTDDGARAAGLQPGRADASSPTTHPHGLILQAMLIDYCRTLIGYLNSDDRSGKDSRAESWEWLLSAITGEMAKVVGSMRGQAVMSLRFQRDRQLPDLESYFSLSCPSCGVHLGAALACAFIPEVTRGDWSRWLPAARYGSRVLRLANDCSTFGREMEEGSLNSIAIALEWLGHPPDRSYAVSGPEVGAALAFLRDRMNFELAMIELSVPADWGDPRSPTPLGLNILGTVANAVSHYQETDLALEGAGSNQS